MREELSQRLGLSEARVQVSGEAIQVFQSNSNQLVVIISHILHINFTYTVYRTLQ